MIQTTELSKPNDFCYNSFHVHLPMVRELVVNTVVNNILASKRKVTK